MNHARKPKLAELKVAGELGDVQWTVLLTASVTGLFMAMATLRDQEAPPPSSLARHTPQFKPKPKPKPKPSFPFD